MPRLEDNKDQNHLFPENPNTTTNTSGYVPMGAPDTEVDALDPYQKDSNVHYTESNPYNQPNSTNNPNNSNPNNYPNSNNFQNPNYPQNNQAFDPNFDPNYNPNYNSNYQPYNNQNQNFDPNLDPNFVNQDPAAQPTPQGFQAPKNEKKGLWAFVIARWWLVLFLIFGIALLLVGSYAFYTLVLSKPAPAQVVNTDYGNVSATIQAPKTLPKGSPGEWQIVVKNNEAVPIELVEVDLKFDKIFQFVEAKNPDPMDARGTKYQITRLETASSGGVFQAVIRISGILIGEIDQESDMSGSVSYTPTGTSQRRSIAINTETTKITSSVITRTLIPTNTKVQNGGQAEIALNFQNTSEQELQDLRIRFTYPNGFDYASSDFIVDNQILKRQPDDGNNIWFLNRFPKLSQRSVKVRGKVTGANEALLNFTAEISVKTKDNTYKTLTAVTGDVQVMAQPLVVSTKIEGKEANSTFQPDETLTFVIDYKNNGNDILQNVEIFASVDDPAEVLDWTTLSFVGGSIGDQNSNTIVWSGRRVPQLSNLPRQQSGILKYTIKTKSDKFIKAYLNSDQYTVRPRVQFQAVNFQKTDEAGPLYKARGGVNFDQKVESLGLVNGQTNKERFRVTWTLTTLQNEINEVSIETVSGLPETAFQPGSITPASLSSQLTYNKLNGKIVWNVGRITNYAGISKASVVISFEIEVEATNATNNSTKNVTLFEPAKIVGIDNFTNEKYQSTGDAAVTK